MQQTLRCYVVWNADEVKVFRKAGLRNVSDVCLRRNKSLAVGLAFGVRWPATALQRSSVVVSGVTVNLTTDFALWPPGAVNIYVSGAGTHRLKQFIQFSG